MPTVFQIIKRYHYAIVGGLLCLMFGLGVTSMSHDSAIIDEIAHIPAGYINLHYGDYRLNPEHPPLIKALSAVPLQFMKLVFPLNIAAWTTDVNGQWESGWHFLYHEGNNADKILFFSRLPILLLSVAFAALFYEIIRRNFGMAVGLIAVFLYSLEPNILAHSRLVTTDIGVTVFTFLAVYSFVKFLQKPTFKAGVVAAMFLAVAQLSKFSAVILVPLYIGLAIIAVICWDKPDQWQKRFKVFGLGFVGIGLAALVMVWLVYVPLTINMPEAVQQKLVEGSLTKGWARDIGLTIVGYNHIPGVKAIVQYILGVLMVIGRVGGGNTTYFLGTVSNQSFVWFFPLTYLIKTPIPLLILIITALYLGAIKYLKNRPFKVWSHFRQFAQKHFLRLAALLYVIIYAFTSISGNLNLGIRHLLSMFPFILMLVAYSSVTLVRKTKLKRVWVVSITVFLTGYYALANLLTHPSYIAYFNELIGGPGNAYKYVTDSSIDWGQDLLRLRDYVDKNNIEKIAVDYFGGGEPKYYFCERKYSPDRSLIKNASGYDCSHSPYVEWHAQNGLYRGYMAISETFLMNDLYYAPFRGDIGYSALRQMLPIAKIGNSIYVYKIP